MSSEIARLYVSIGAKTKEFQRGIKGVQQTMKKIGGAMTKYVTLPLAGVGVAALKMSMDLEKGLANVDTLLGGNAARIAEFKTGIQDLAMVTGKATGDLTDGMYQVVSAFGDTEHSLYLLDTAARAGAAGLSSTEASINLLSGVIKGYNMDIEEAGRVSDLAFATVRMGQTTFDELAANMGAVIPLASTLNVQQEELWGTMATLTGVTGNTSEVSTQFRGILTSLIRPTKDMSDALETMGYDSGRAALEALGLEGTLHGLVDIAGGSDEALAKMFGRVEALSAALALTGAQSDTWNEKMAEMGDVAGETAKAFEIQSQTMAFRMDQLKQTGAVILQELGDVIREAVVPILEALLPIIQRLVEWFREASPAVKQMLVVVGAVLLAIGPLLMLISAMLPAIAAIGAVFAGVTLVVVAKALLIVAAVAGLIAIVKHAWQNSEIFRDVVTAVWETVKTVILTAISVISETGMAIIKVFQGDFVGAWQHMSNVGEAIIKGFQGIVMQVFNAIAIHVLRKIEEMLIGLERLTAVLPGVQAAIRGAREGIQSRIATMQADRDRAASARSAEAFAKKHQDTMAGSYSDALDFQRRTEAATAATGGAVQDLTDDFAALSNVVGGGGSGGSSGGSGGSSGSPVTVAAKGLYERLQDDIARVSGLIGDEVSEAWFDEHYTGGIEGYLAWQERRKLAATPSMSGAETGGTSENTINHTGTITVKGVNSHGELVAVVDAVMDRLSGAISDGNRRIPTRTAANSL